MKCKRYVKRPRIQSYSGLYFPALGLNLERYKVSLPIQSKCGKTVKVACVVMYNITIVKSRAHEQFRDSRENMLEHQLQTCYFFWLVYKTEETDGINKSIAEVAIKISSFKYLYNTYRNNITYRKYNNNTYRNLKSICREVIGLLRRNWTDF